MPPWACRCTLIINADRRQKSLKIAMVATEQEMMGETGTPVDDGSAQVPIYLRFEQSDEGDMVYWAVSGFAERVAGFEFLAAAVGGDNWTALVTVPQAGNRQYYQKKNSRQMLKTSACRLF